MTASYSGAGDGYVSGLVEVCTLFAPNSGLRFSTLHTLSFLFIRYLVQPMFQGRVSREFA